MEASKHMSKQRPAADRHQAFVGDPRRGGKRVELTVALGGEDDDAEAVRVRTHYRRRS